MIAGSSVIRVVLLAATFGAALVLLVAATTTTTSADSGGAKGQAPAAAGTRSQEPSGAAAVAAALVDSPVVELAKGGGERKSVRGLVARGAGKINDEDEEEQEEEEEVKAFKVPFSTGGGESEEAIRRIGGSSFAPVDPHEGERIQFQSIPIVGRLKARSSSASNLQQEAAKLAAEFEPTLQGSKNSPQSEKDQQQQQQQLSAAVVQSRAAPTAGLARGPVYTNQFVIQVKGGELEARQVAEKHGFVYLNHILDDYYHLEHRRLSKRSTSPHQDALNISIQDEPQVILLERQVLKRRVKRDFLEFSGQQQAPGAPTNYEQAGRVLAASAALAPAQAGSQNSHPVHLRPANQAHQHQLSRPAQQQQQQQPLRPNLSASQRKPAPGPAHHQHHQYTRPANQPRGPQPQLRLSPQQQQQETTATGRTQEMLEAAASNAGILYQQATATAASMSPPPPPPPSQKAGGVSRAQPTAQATTVTTTTAATTTTLPNAAAASQLPISLSSQLLSLNATLQQGSNGQQQQQQHHQYHELLRQHRQQQQQRDNSADNGKQMPFNDPSWPLMWYLDGGAKNGFDLNVMAAWKMGYTGKGIVITILDDGLEKDHPDLQANYDPLASFDINGDDADPMPRYDVNDSNRHGTRCAGEVAAVPDNNICSIGIAYNSKVGGVRMLDGDVTDAVEARSLGLNNQHIHIYSASWGPDDNGKTVDGPGEMATRAFIEGVTNGRQGLGSIFVFASGNGGREHDNCNCDGYTNSIWTLSISSATENGYVPWYIEACSSTLATTYSSGSYEERQIATTDLHHSCTSSHTGTSASAPLAAGICALVLESNPKLTWRDMQHIVVRTAKQANLVAKDWRTNALGRNVSHAFGYGLMDAAAMITMAKRWTTVPIQYTCEVRSPQMEKFIPAKGYIELKLRAECANVRYLEHVQSKVTLTASRRGDLHIYLISPHGTRSTLLAQRPNDQAEQGFRNWPFMTVHSWGESPNGIWTLEVHNDGKPQNRAYLKEWTLILYGTSEDPNKHLDPAALTQATQLAVGQSGGLPPPMSQPRPTIQVTSSQLPPPLPAPPTSSTPANESPAISGPNNPLAGPISEIQHSAAGQYPSLELEPAPPSRQPSSHWSFSSNPPPPVSTPGAAPASVTPQPQAPATSPASYVTTFKTIVINNNNNNNNALPGEAPVIQQTQQHPANGGRINLQPPASPSGQTSKADFEIVSPATTQTPANNYIQNNVSTIATTTTTSSPSPSATSAAADGSLQPVDSVGITKPSVSQLDISGGSQQSSGSSNNLGSRLNEPPGQQLAGSGGGGPLPPPPPPPPPNTNELDGNQIDSKLTKDYRSSDRDQSIYGAPKQLLNANDRMIANGNGQEADARGNLPASGGGGGGSSEQVGSAAAASATLNQPKLALCGCPLLTLLMLIIISYQHYSTTRLVRLEYVLAAV